MSWWWPTKAATNDAERIANLEAQLLSLRRAYDRKDRALGCARTDEALMKTQREIIVNQRIELCRLGKRLNWLEGERSRLAEQVRVGSEATK